MKGIVTDLRLNEVVLLTENGEFNIVKNRNYQVGEQIEYREKRNFHYNSLVASFVLFAFLGFSGYLAYYTPVSSMSVDINPSMQFDLNIFNKVINAYTYNDEAQNLLSTIDVQNKNANEVLDKVIKKSKENGYLSDDSNQVEIDISSKKTTLVEKVQEHISEYSNEGLEVKVDRSSKSEKQLSKEYGVSMGKVKAIVEYTKINGGIESENLVQLKEDSIQEIKEAVQESKKETKQENKKNNANDLKKKETETEIKNEKSNEINNEKDRKKNQNQSDEKSNEKANEEIKSEPTLKEENQAKKQNSNSKEKENNKVDKKSKNNKDKNK